MATIPRTAILKQEAKECVTVPKTLNYSKSDRLLGSPFAIVRPVRSIAETSIKDPNTIIKQYYPSIGSAIVLPPQPYELISIDEQFEGLRSDHIAIHNLSRLITEQNAGFVKIAQSEAIGEILTSSTNISPTKFPHSKSGSQDTKTDSDLELDEEAWWRGVLSLPSSTNILFSKKIEVKVDELPSWEPHITSDSYRIEDDE